MICIEIKFKNGSEIKTIDSIESVRSKNADKLIYVSSANEKYTEWKKKPWLVVEALNGIKFPWYTKLQIYFYCKYIDIKDYYTNPYKIINRQINKCTKPYLKRRWFK